LTKHPNSANKSAILESVDASIEFKRIDEGNADDLRLPLTKL